MHNISPLSLLPASAPLLYFPHHYSNQCPPCLLSAHPCFCSAHRFFAPPAQLRAAWGWGPSLVLGRSPSLKCLELTFYNCIPLLTPVTCKPWSKTLPEEATACSTAWFLFQPLVGVDDHQLRKFFCPLSDIPSTLSTPTFPVEESCLVANNPTMPLLVLGHMPPGAGLTHTTHYTQSINIFFFMYCIS